MVRTYLPEAIKLVLMKEVLEMLGREDCSRREEQWYWWRTQGGVQLFLQPLQPRVTWLLLKG